jgi:hypothetical protein
MPADAQGKFTVEQRREQVAQLYLAGATQPAIAKQLGVALGTVNRDIQHVKAMWRESQIEAMDDAVTRHLTELDFIRQQLRLDYNATKNPNILKELIRVQEREAKLLGLDAPQRQHVTTTPTTIEIVFGGDDDQSTDTYS